MLYLKPPYYLINGVTVFRDHEDVLQWYFLPGSPEFAKIEADGKKIPAFQLIKYRGRAGNGGFLNFDVDLAISDEILEEVKRQIKSREHLNDDPRLSPVLLEDGTVKMMLFGKESGGPDEEDNATPQFVLKIDHHAKPALYGNNQAAFSVQLDQEGVTVLEEAMKGEMSPIGVVYSLDYLALRPAYNVSLSIDWNRVQTHMEEHFGVNTLVASVDIDTVVDELIEKRVIEIKADTFVPDGDEEDGVSGRRDQALSQVREMITDAFFTPSLDPFQEKEDGWDKAANFFDRISSINARGGQSALFNYSKLDYTRIDKKSLNVSISERTTVKRSIYPQGHLSGLFRAIRREGLNPDDFMLEVDLDDPWFERRRVKVIARTDFEADNVLSVNVNLKYGTKPQNVILDAKNPTADVDWASIIKDNAMMRDVTVDYTVTFKAADGAERPTRLTSEKFTFTGDNLEIDPRGDELYSLNTVPVVALNFPFDHYPAVEVRTRYNDPDHDIRLSDTFLLKEGTAEQRWQRFMRDPAKTDFLYQIIYRAANSEDIIADWITASDDQVIIRDPFPKKLSLAVVPSFKWDDVDRAFVDLRYEDLANDLDVTENFEFTEDEKATRTFVVDLQDPTIRAITYSVTVLFKDGRVLEIPPSVTRQPRIILSAEMRGHQVVEVRPPAPTDFTKKKLKQVTVSLNYSDSTNRLSAADEFVFTPKTEPQFFEFDYADPSRLRYGYSLKYTFTNNLSKTVPDLTAMETLLEVPVP